MSQSEINGFSQAYYGQFSYTTLFEAIKGQKEKKLSVSIAAPALNSQLIHLGLNIQTENTPVPTVGLKDWKINIKNFAQNCLQRFQQEEENILKASYKVRSVI